MTNEKIIRFIPSGGMSQHDWPKFSHDFIENVNQTTVNSCTHSNNSKVTVTGVDQNTGNRVFLELPKTFFDDIQKLK